MGVLTYASLNLDRMYINCEAKEFAEIANKEKETEIAMFPRVNSDKWEMDCYDWLNESCSDRKIWEQRHVAFMHV